MLKYFQGFYPRLVLSRNHPLLLIYHPLIPQRIICIPYFYYFYQILFYSSQYHKLLRQFINALLFLRYYNSSCVRKQSIIIQALL